MTPGSYHRRLWLRGGGTRRLAAGVGRAGLWRCCRGGGGCSAVPWTAGVVAVQMRRGLLAPCRQSLAGSGWKCWWRRLSGGAALWQTGLAGPPKPAPRTLCASAPGLRSVGLVSVCDTHMLCYTPVHTRAHALTHTYTRAHTRVYTYSFTGPPDSPTLSPGSAVSLAFPGPPGCPRRVVLVTWWPLARSGSRCIVLSLPPG